MTACALPSPELRAFSLDCEREGARSCRRGGSPTKWGQNGSFSARTGSGRLRQNNTPGPPVGSHTPGPGGRARSIGTHTWESGQWAGESRGTSDHRPMRSSGGTLLSTPKPMRFSLDSTSPRPVRQTSVLIYFCHKSDWHGFLLPAKEYKCRGSRSYYDKRGAFMKLSHSKNCSGGG